MRVLFLVAAVTALASSASAQQKAPDRIAQQIGQLLIQLETQRDQIDALTKLVAEKDAKIKEIEEKAKK